MTAKSPPLTNDIQNSWMVAPWGAGLAVFISAVLIWQNGWAPVGFLVSALVVGIVVAGAMVLYWRTRKRLWLVLSFLLVMLVPILAGKVFHVDPLGLHNQCIGFCFAPILILSLFARGWLRRFCHLSDVEPGAEKGPMENVSP